MQPPAAGTVVGDAADGPYLFAPEGCHRTERLLLRSYRTGDGPLLAAASNASFEHLRPWMPWAAPDQTVVQAEQLVRSFRARWLLASDFVIAIADAEDRELLGGTGFHRFEPDLSHGTAEIGMWIAGPRAGQGLGTEALRGLLDWGFGDDWPWLRLTWHCDARNIASRRVAEKAGMTLEATRRGDMNAVDGTRRDTLIFAALRDEWNGSAR